VDETPVTGGTLETARAGAALHEERGVVTRTTGGDAGGGLRGRTERLGLHQEPALVRDGRGLQQARVPSRNGAGTEAMVIGFIGLTLLSWIGVSAP
jgi:hypothetical protein